MNANNSHPDVPDAALRRKIEERAYHIWLEKGGGHGDHEHHWFEAERELMETAKQERAAIRSSHGKKIGKPHKS